MARASNPPTTDLATVQELRQLADVLNTLKVKLPNGVTGADIRKVADEADKDLQSIAAAKTQLAKMQDAKDTKVAKLKQHRTDLRTGVKAIFGDDSAEYQMVGGIKKSERKRPTKKVAAG